MVLICRNIRSKKLTLVIEVTLSMGLKRHNLAKFAFNPVGSVYNKERGQLELDVFTLFICVVLMYCLWFYIKPSEGSGLPA